MINIIFLDIDNVLNYGCCIKNKSEEEMYGFAPELLNNLKHILQMIPNTYVVISSSWRMTVKMDHISKTRNWRNVLEERLEMPGVIIDDIPHVNEYPTDDGFDSTDRRGEDIQSWLNINEWRNIRKFVVIDDSMSCGTIPKIFPNNFVNCDEHMPFEGLSIRNSIKVMKILV